VQIDEPYLQARPGAGARTVWRRSIADARAHPLLSGRKTKRVNTRSTGSRHQTRSPPSRFRLMMRPCELTREHANAPASTLNPKVAGSIPRFLSQPPAMRHARQAITDYWATNASGCSKR
jgi:hypothetical protein